ncbi:hypothetical protein Tco_0922283 [Tanacetum coccineum]|uniref:THAP-type domain-containing protein n=1 Tax=Tanacetum coccineum TaxID=301880 RepID=A0ABQ5CYL5_9ASTR
MTSRPHKPSRTDVLETRLSELHHRAATLAPPTEQGRNRRVLQWWSIRRIRSLRRIVHMNGEIAGMGEICFCERHFISGESESEPVIGNKATQSKWVKRQEVPSQPRSGRGNIRMSNSKKYPSGATTEVEGITVGISPKRITQEGGDPTLSSEASKRIMIS